MQNVRRLAVASAVAVTTLLLTTPALLAQTPGEFNQVPEAAPVNWSWLFMAIPIFALSILFFFAFWFAYARIMTRMRYPRTHKS